MQHVFVVDTDRKPCNPVDPGKARILLSQGKAAVLRRFPFTIVLKDVSVEAVRPYRLKFDPGSKQTGIALVDEESSTVVFAMEIIHRGRAISKDLESRKGIRRSRRNRHTRYRKPGLPNTTRPQGWLAPSLKHRVFTVSTWKQRISRYAPVANISQELVRFDMQAMECPEIGGAEYQQGTLAGYEIREYLLNKWSRKCAYCGAENTPLQIEHIHAKANGGTNRISNLALACTGCNTKKGTLDIKVFLKSKPELLAKIEKQAKASLKDAAAVNATRWALFSCLKETGIPVETGSGGRTKFNRVSQGYPKAHWIDAACVGVFGAKVTIPADIVPLIAKATGHGNRQMCKVDKYGFPIAHISNIKTSFGYRTGDIVNAKITGKSKFAGEHTGRVSIRQRPCFGLNGFDVHPKYLTKIQKGDGYEYNKPCNSSRHL